MRSVIARRPLRRRARRAVVLSATLNETRPGPTDARSWRPTATWTVLRPPLSAPRRAKARASKRDFALRTTIDPRSVRLRCGLVTRSRDAAAPVGGAPGGGGGGGGAPGGGGGGGGGGGPPPPPRTVIEPLIPVCRSQKKSYRPAVANVQVPDHAAPLGAAGMGGTAPPPGGSACVHEAGCGPPVKSTLWG